MTASERQFLDAALKGHTNKLKALLEAGVNINVGEPDGVTWNRTALMHAAEKGHQKAVELLLKAGADINAKDKGDPGYEPGGNTALILAIRAGHVAVAHRLLEAGASVKSRGGGTSVITAAAYLGDEGLFRRLVDLGADINQRDGSGFTPISSAALQLHVEIVQFLLSLGVDPNSLTPGGTPVLVDAAMGDRPGQLELCRALVGAGADPNRGNEIHFTPLMAACRFANVELVKYLLSLTVRVNAIERENRCTVLDFVHRLQKPEDPEFLRRRPDVRRAQEKHRPRLKAIERLLRRAGARKASELPDTQSLGHLTTASRG